MPKTSIPQCSKKRRSSVASVALTIWSGISSSGTASLCRMPRLPISLPFWSRNLTANCPVRNLPSLNSWKAGMASANMTMKPPAPSVSPSEAASLSRRFQPVSLKRAKKLVPAFQTSRNHAHVSARVESIFESRPSQLTTRSRRPLLKSQSCTSFMFPASSAFAGAPRGGASGGTKRESRNACPLYLCRHGDVKAPAAHL